MSALTLGELCPENSRRTCEPSAGPSRLPNAGEGEGKGQKQIPAPPPRGRRGEDGGQSRELLQRVDARGGTRRQDGLRAAPLPPAAVTPGLLGRAPCRPGVRRPLAFFLWPG